MKEELLEFEKKLLQLRMEMGELLKQIDSESDIENRAKLRQLESELGYVIRQYRSLENKINANGQNIMPPLQPMQQPQPVQRVPQVQPVPIKPVASVPVSASKKNMENTIGTSLMGILASGLIFISIILFATLGLPYLSDVFKMLACYVISIAVIAVSMYKLDKNPGNKFYLSLSGCGVGALYISILLTNIYFEYINDITLFIFITIWVFFMCALSKIKSRLFAVIAHIGIMIAVMFGTVLCISESDMVKFGMLTVFFVVSTVTLYVIHFDKRLVKNILVNVFAMISLFVLVAGAGVIIGTYYNAYFLCIAMVIMVFLGAVIYCDWSDSQIGYGVMPMAYVILLLLVSEQFFETDEQIGMFAYIISMAMIFVVELKKSKYVMEENYGKYLLQIFMIIFAWAGIFSLDIDVEYVLIPMMALPLMALGIWKENPLCKYVGMFSVFMFITGNIEIMLKFGVSLISLIVLYVIAYMKNETKGYKVCLHLLSIVFVLASVSELLGELIGDYQTEDALVFIIIAVFNMIMFRLAFVRDESVTVYNIVNAVMMLFGLEMITGNTPLHILVILVAIAVFMVNSKNYLDGEKLVPGIYVGIKFTILLLVILDSFDTENFVVSVLLIVAAILSIVIGFVFRYKALRVYGLALSMISIFKLIMVDIHYDNTLGNALSFFISGVLCFAISMIYNYIGKKIEESSE